MAAYPDKYDYNEARVSPIQVALFSSFTVSITLNLDLRKSDVILCIGWVVRV